MKTHKFKSKSPFILASSSPRRIQLLKTILKDFEVIPSSAEEIQPGTFKPENLVIKNEDIKCIGIAKKYPNCWVLGSDTLVALEDLVLGKPNDFEDAVKTLSKLLLHHLVFDQNWPFRIREPENDISLPFLCFLF